MTNNKSLGNITAFLGNIFEHLETSAFTFTGALVIHYFFPDDPETFLHKYGVWIAVSGSFLIQPFGALIFSWIGDRFGRSPALKLAYLLSIVPSLAIILIPSYASIGFASSILLLLCRVSQGMGCGGAFGGRIVFVIESNEGSKRLLNTGILAATGFIGALIATGSSALFMSHKDAMLGWKAPYFIIVILGTILILMRRFFNETPPFLSSQKHKEKERPLRKIVTQYPKEILFVLFLGMASLVPYYLGLSWMSAYLKQQFQQTDGHILGNVTAILFLSGFCIVCIFMLVGKYKIKLSNCFMVSILMSMLVTCLYYVGFATKSEALLTTALYMLPLYMSAINPTIFLCPKDLFAVRERYRLFSIPFAIGQALMTGTTPLFAEALYQWTQDYRAVVILPALSTGLLIA